MHHDGTRWELETETVFFLFHVFLKLTLNYRKGRSW
jgi:hypothetical protein